jgi:hypothetical protein
MNPSTTRTNTTNNTHNHIGTFDAFFDGINEYIATTGTNINNDTFEIYTDPTFIHGADDIDDNNVDDIDANDDANNDNDGVNNRDIVGDNLDDYNGVSDDLGGNITTHMTTSDTTTNNMVNNVNSNAGPHPRNSHTPQRRTFTHYTRSGKL